MKQFRCALFVTFALIEGATLAAATAPHAALQVKHGLWMFSDTTNVKGDTVFPDTMNTPSGDRAHRLEDIRRMLSQPSRERECLTQASLEQRVFAVGRDCKQTIVSNNPHLLEVQTECHDKIGSFTQTTNRRLVISSPTSATTTTHSVSTKDGKTMTMESVESGHLVSPDCGNVNTIEQLP